MSTTLRRGLIAVLFTLVIAPGAAVASTELVLLVTIDGLRWQEVFGGLDMRLVTDEQGGMESATEYRRRLNADTPEERRQVLLPFFWEVIARDGVVLGSPDAGSAVTVANPYLLSYPGYNELLTGVVDPGIRSNARLPNRNVTVLEWLHAKPGFTGRIHVFGSWELFNVILNEDRAGFPVNAGWDDPLPEHTERSAAINRLVPELPRFWSSVRLDIITHVGALESLRHDKPRVLYVAYGEVDDWGHDRRYDMYLDAAERTDRYIRELWEAAQSIPEYAGKTSLIITTDHGRGDTPADWTSHGPDVAGADRIWIAAMGAGIKSSGLMTSGRHNQGQIAATVAALLGEEWQSAAPDAAPPLPILE